MKRKVYAVFLSVCLIVQMTLSMTVFAEGEPKETEVPEVSESIPVSGEEKKETEEQEAETPAETGNSENAAEQYLNTGTAPETEAAFYAAAQPYAEEGPADLAAGSITVAEG